MGDANRVRSIISGLYWEDSRSREHRPGDSSGSPSHTNHWGEYGRLLIYKIDETYSDDGRLLGVSESYLAEKVEPRALPEPTRFDPYIQVEAIEADLDKALPPLTEEQFVTRRKILADHVFPWVDRANSGR
jgi:hypothetical protein